MKIKKSLDISDRTVLFSFGLLIGFLIAYLIGCFTSADFNIQNWAETSRVVIAFIGTIFGLLLGVALNIINSD